MKHPLLLIGVGIIAWSCSSSSVSHEQNIAIVKEYVESVENLDYSTMETLLSENYIGLGPSANDTTRKAAAVENWKQNVEELYESIEYTRSQFAGIVIEQGENQGNWVANWAELTINYKDGRGPVKIWSNSNYKIEDGKIVKSYTFYNEADVLEQLGYVFINPDNL